MYLYVYMYRSGRRTLVGESNAVKGNRLQRQAVRRDRASLLEASEAEVCW